jgi:hypothetical protein
VGIAGLGVGAGARGITGISNLFGAHAEPSRRPLPPPSLLPVPIPGRRPEEDEEDPLRKAAAAISKVAEVRPGLNWWQIPASAALGAGGVAGGWELMDAILNSRRRVEMDQELADVQTEYEDALRNQYEQALMKRGELDEIFEKHAGSDWLGDLWEMIKGGYATGLGLSAGAGALGGYRWAKSRNRNLKLDEALRRRKQLRAGRIEPLYAYPVPADYRPKQVTEEDTAEVTM